MVADGGWQRAEDGEERWTVTNGARRKKGEDRGRRAKAGGKMR